MGPVALWRNVQRTLEDISVSIHCHEIREILENPQHRTALLNPRHRPSFDILVQILSFFQSYQIIEQTLTDYHPLARDPFPVNVVKGGAGADSEPEE